MSMISDIGICYSDIGRKHVGWKTVILISEEFQYRHQSPFRYKNIYIHTYWDQNHASWFPGRAHYHCADQWTVGCQISNIGWKFIPISDIMSESALFSQISQVPMSGSVRYRWSRILTKCPSMPTIYVSWSVADIISCFTPTPPPIYLWEG
jgi:hypothetical protein